MKIKSILISIPITQVNNLFDYHFSFWFQLIPISFQLSISQCIIITCMLKFNFKSYSMNCYVTFSSKSNYFKKNPSN